MAPSPDDRFAVLVGRGSGNGWRPADLLDEEDDDEPRSRPVPTRTAVLAVLGVLVAGIVAFVLFAPGAGPVDVIGPDPVSATTAVDPAEAAGGPSAGPGGSGTAAATELTVHVVGAVEDPAVVTLPAGARVADALAAAGGATAEADTAAINLARALVDGEQIVVPVRGEQAAGAAPPVPAPPGAAPGAAPPGSPGGEPGTPVNINTADAAALDTLPGVGPATAEAIITHRTEHGPFAAVDDLVDVPGIGEATLARLRDLVTV